MRSQGEEHRYNPADHPSPSAVYKNTASYEMFKAVYTNLVDKENHGNLRAAYGL